MTILKHHLTEYISEADIQKRVKEIGEQITADYKGEELILIGVLKGSYVFMADLARHIDLLVQVTFVSVSSYLSGTKSSGEVRMLYDVDCSLEHNNVLVVEDIVDTGNTLSYLMELFSARNPKTLRLCTMLDKPSRRMVPVEVAYTGFSIEDEFVVGYGLDYAGRHRNLKHIAKVVFE